MGGNRSLFFRSILRVSFLEGLDRARVIDGSDHQLDALGDSCPGGDGAIRIDCLSDIRDRFTFA